jgi:hypothetical protein
VEGEFLAFKSPSTHWRSSPTHRRRRASIKRHSKRCSPRWSHRANRCAALPMGNAIRRRRIRKADCSGVAVDERDYRPL